MQVFNLPSVDEESAVRSLPELCTTTSATLVRDLGEPNATLHIRDWAGAVGRRIILLRCFEEDLLIRCSTATHTHPGRDPIQHLALDPRKVPCEPGKLLFMAFTYRHQGNIS